MSKVGRNDLCTCKSGKKYKKCCESSRSQNISFSTPAVDDNEPISFEKSAIYDRNGAMSIPFDEGAGSINFLHHVGGTYDCMEAFKPDCFIRVKTPERIDPEHEFPNTRPQAQIVHEYGSSNLVLARMYIQNVDILEQAHFDGGLEERNERKKEITWCLRKASEELIACHFLYKELYRKINEAKQTVKKSKGEAIQVPRTPNLETEVKECLIHLYQFLRWLLKSLNPLYDFEKNFDSPRYDKLIEWLKENHPEKDEIIQLLEEHYK